MFAKQVGASQGSYCWSNIEHRPPSWEGTMTKAYVTSDTAAKETTMEEINHINLLEHLTVHSQQGLPNYH